MAGKVCKDCGAGKRPAPYPGPRCATHHRKKKKAAKKTAHEAYVFKTYGLKAGQYDELYARQGGVCFICQVAKGVVKKLAVDHDHASGYVRGLLCSLSPCNKMLGYLKDDDQAFQRAAFYLRQPPAYRWIGKIRPGGSGS